MKGLAFSAGVATDLALVEDQGQGIARKRIMVSTTRLRFGGRRGAFEVTVGGDGGLEDWY